MEHSYDKASSLDDHGEVVLLKNEIDSQFLKSNSPQNFQFTGPPFRHRNSTAAKPRDLYPQPKILLEKLCIDTNKATTTLVSTKLDDISGVHRTAGIMENGDGKMENAENGLKRKSPSSVTNKKKPYRSAARSEMKPGDGDTSSQGELGSGLMDCVSPRKEKEYLQNKLDADQANNNASDSCPGMSSSCLSLKDNQTSCLTTKRDEFCHVADNFTNDDIASDLWDVKEQNAGPNHNLPNDITSAVCDVAYSVAEPISEQTVVNSSGSLKVKISRIRSRSQSQNEDGMNCQMSSTEDNATTVAPTVNIRRGNRIAKSLVARTVNKVQRLQSARKFGKPYRRQRYARWFDFQIKVKNNRNSHGTRHQRGKDRDVDTEERDEDYDIPAKRLHQEPSFEQLEVAPTTATRRVGDNQEVLHDRSVFADISFTYSSSSRPKPCSKVDVLSEWEASGTVDSRVDDKISSTVACSSGDPQPQSSYFANRRENIFEKFRSPVETDDPECLNLSRAPREPPRVPEETAPQPRDKDPTLAAAAVGSPDLKDLFGDCDSDSTECCRYEEMDPLFNDSAATAAGGQLGGLPGSPETYPGFSQFSLPSDSDDNLIVDESMECQRVDPEKKGPARKANHDDQDSDEDRQLKKLRSTAYRTYTRMQRRRGLRAGGGVGGGGTVRKSNQNAVAEAASATVADDSVFKPPESHVTRRRRVNAAKQTALKRKPIGLINVSSDATMTIPAARRQTMMSASEKAKKKNKNKNSRGSSSAQKAVRLLYKEFATRSKSRATKVLEDKEEEEREGESDRFQSPPDAPDCDAGDVTESPQRRRHHREPEEVVKSAPGDKDRVKRSRSKSKSSSSNDSRIAKKSGRPGKCRTSAVKVKVKVKAKIKVASESDPSDPPKIDILSRELGPRYNWLEQKIQAMQRSGSADEASSEALRSGGGQSAPRPGPTAPGPDDKDQPAAAAAGGRGCASDGEDGRRSNPKCSNQRSPHSSSSSFSSSSSSNSTGTSSSSSSLRNNSTSGDWMSPARERRTTTDDNYSCTNRTEVAVNFSHEAASVRTGLREVSLPTEEEGHPLALKEARPAFVYSAPSALDVCLTAAMDGREYTSAASSTDPRMCADYSRGFETRPEGSCPSLSQSDGMSSYRGTPGGGLDPGYASVADGPLVLARSVSLTNLNAEDERYYGGGSQILDVPVPFDLRLPKVSCNNNNNSNNSNAFEKEKHSDRHVETPSSNGNAALGHVTPFPNDDWAPRRALLPDPESSGKWLQEDAKNTDPAVGIDPIVIDLTSESDPRSLLNQEEQEEERSRPQQQASHRSSSPPPVLRTIKSEYERRLEMYERLSKVSKIKDQEIAILESERKRVRGELECLKSIFLKAAQSQAAAMDGAGGPLLDDAAVEDFRKITEAHGRDSTVRLLANRTPPEAHSAKVDLSRYSYLRCRYERDRSVLDFTSDAKASNGSGVPDPGPVRNSSSTELSLRSPAVSPFLSSSTKNQFSPSMVRPVLQQHDPNPTAKFDEVQCGSDEQTWNSLPSVNDSEQLEVGQSGHVVPLYATSDRGKALPVSGQVRGHRPDSRGSSLSDQNTRRHGNAVVKENDVIVIGDQSQRPKQAAVDALGRRIQIQNEAMDLSGGKGTCVPAGTEVLNARNTQNTDDSYPGTEAALNLMKSRGAESFPVGSQLRIGREADGAKVKAKQVDAWKASEACDKDRARGVSTDCPESSSGHRKPEHGFRRTEERRPVEVMGQGEGNTVDGENNQRTKSDRFRRLASSEVGLQQAGSSTEPMLTGGVLEFGPKGRSTIPGLDQQSAVGKGIEVPPPRRVSAVPHPVAPELAAPFVDRGGDVGLPGTSQPRLPKQQRQQQQQVETFPSYPDRHGMSANLQDMSFMVSAISKTGFPRSSSTSRLADQQRKSTPDITATPRATTTTNEKLPRRTPPPTHHDVVVMTTAAASNYTRTIVHHQQQQQRHPDRGEKQPPLGPCPPAEPPLSGLHRRRPTDPGLTQLLESGNGSVPSLQRYNELHQTMNRQARQHLQQRPSPPMPTGLNPPREAMLLAPLPASARSEPPAQEAVQYRRHARSGGGGHQVPVLRHSEGRPPPQEGFGSASLQTDVQPNLPFYPYQKGVPAQVRQHDFHADPSVTHLSYSREPAPYADFNGSAFGVGRVVPEMQRDGAALVPCSDEGLTVPAKLLNAVALVNNILFPETQARPQRPLNKNDLYEPGPVPSNTERLEYAPVASGVHNTSNNVTVRVNQDSSPVRGHRRSADFHRRHPRDHVSMIQQQPHSMDPAKLPPPPPPGSGVRDSIRLHHSLAADRYLPTYIESISATTQHPYPPSRTVLTSQQVPPPRHGTTARDDQSKAFQLPPGRPGPGPGQNPLRMHLASAGVNGNEVAASLIPLNHHPFYSPPTGVMQLGFNSGNANPGVLQVERHQFRPGFEQPYNAESLVPSPYAAGNHRIQMGTNPTAGGIVMTNQPTAAMATHLRHRRQQHQRTPDIIQSNRTGQMKIQAAQDLNKTQHQEQITTTTSQTTKAGDYICDVCRKPAMFVCSACKGVAYCSTECQAVSWQTKHSAVCRQL